MIGIDITCTQNQYKSRGIGIFTKNVIDKLILKDSKKFILFGYDAKSSISNFGNNEFQIIGKLENLNPVTRVLNEYNLRQKINYYNKARPSKKITNFFSPYIHSGVPYSTEYKTFVFVHDLIQKENNIYSTKNFLVNYIKKVQYNYDWKNIKKAKGIMTNSFTSANSLAKYFKLNDSHIMYLGVDHELYNPKKLCDKEVLNKYGVKGKYILYYGGSEFNKNVDMVIASFNKYTEMYRDSELSLVVIGDQNNITLLSDRIKVIGFVSDEDKISLMKGASAYINLSSIEGFGMSVLENISTGVPCIVSDTPIYKELYEGGVLFVDITDKKMIPGNCAALINDILHNENLKNFLVENALKISQNFNWQKTADNIFNIIKE